jgi:hypothetical protein
MARNIEIKARIASVESMAPKAAAIANAGPIEITQDDTFFRCEAGRLKLRTLSADNGELIFYRRANQHGPKESFYVRSSTSTPERLRESLSLAYGQVGECANSARYSLSAERAFTSTKSKSWGTSLSSRFLLPRTSQPSLVSARRKKSCRSWELSQPNWWKAPISISSPSKACDQLRLRNRARRHRKESAAVPAISAVALTKIPKSTLARKCRYVKR